MLYSTGLWYTPSGGIGKANGRGEFTSPTMSELPVDPATPPVMAVNTGQPVDFQWETSMELDEEPEVPTLWIPEPIGSPREHNGTAWQFTVL